MAIGECAWTRRPRPDSGGTPSNGPDGELNGRAWRLAPLRFRLYLVQTQPMGRVKRRFLYIGLAIATTLLVGTVGFILIAGYPPFDAFYMTLITMTTVGYADRK